jgi:hypothetical protein
MAVIGVGFASQHLGLIQLVNVPIPISPCLNSILSLPVSLRLLAHHLVARHHHWHLLKIQRSIQLGQTCLVRLGGNLLVVDYGSGAIEDGLHAIVRSEHGTIVREESGLVELISLIEGLFVAEFVGDGSIELDHHGGVELASIGVDLTQAIGLHLVLVAVGSLHVLVERDALEVVVVLLLAAESEFGALVQLVGIAFSRDVHHQQLVHEILLLLTLRVVVWTSGGDALLGVLQTHAHQLLVVVMEHVRVVVALRPVHRSSAVTLGLGALEVEAVVGLGH